MPSVPNTHHIMRWSSKKSSSVGHSCVGVNWGLCYPYWSICTPVQHVNWSKWKSNLLSKEFQRPAACSLGLSFSVSFKSQHAFALLGFLQNLSGGALLAGSFPVAPWAGALFLFGSIWAPSPLPLAFIVEASIWNKCASLILLRVPSHGSVRMSKSQRVPLNSLLLYGPCLPDVFLNREKFEEQRDAVESSAVNLIRNEKQKNKKAPVSRYYGCSRKQNKLIQRDGNLKW